MQKASKKKSPPAQQQQSEAQSVTDTIQHQSSADDHRIMVTVRMRPTLNKAKPASLIEASPVDNSIIVKGGFEQFQTTQSVKAFQFDNVFGPNASQSTVYTTMAKPLIRDLCRGINTCILAYGQTGAGLFSVLSYSLPLCR